MKAYVIRRLSDGHYMKSDGYFSKVTGLIPRMYARKSGASHSLKCNKQDGQEYEIIEVRIEGIK